MSLAGSWPTILPQTNIFAGAGRPYAIWWALACFPSAAAVRGVCSDQPLAAAAALTLDRKDTRRKDARRATLHYLDSPFFLKIAPSRGRMIPCRRPVPRPVSETREFRARVATRACMHACMYRAPIGTGRLNDSTDRDSG